MAKIPINISSGEIDKTSNLVVGIDLGTTNSLVAVVDPKTGKVHWDEELGTRVKLEASPTAADGKIYCIDFHGNTFVLKAGKTFKKLYETKMGEGKNQLNRSST